MKWKLAAGTMLVAGIYLWHNAALKKARLRAAREVKNDLARKAA